MPGYCSAATEESRRKKIICALVLLTAILTPIVNEQLFPWLLELAQSCAPAREVLEFLTEQNFSFSVSYITTFSLFYWLADMFFWVVPPLFKMPNLCGTWEGTLHSNYNNDHTDIPMTLKIKQRWMTIHCTAQFPQSSSESEMARVYRKNDDEVRLEFAYSNESQAEGVEQRSYHGYNYFTVRGNTMNGLYFTDRKIKGSDKTTAGHMNLQKVSAGELFKRKASSMVSSLTLKRNCGNKLPDPADHQPPSSV